MTTADTLDPTYVWFTARRWRHPIEDVCPELVDLNPPRLLPGEPVPPTPDRWGPTVFYRPDGTAIDRPWPHCADELPRLGSPEYRIGRTLRFRAGTPLDVRTDFIGIDMGSLGDEPPILWETQVFHAGAPIFTRRYASAAAALHGHRLIVHTLDTARRARRR